MNRKQRRAAAKLGQASNSPLGETEAEAASPAAAKLLGTGLEHQQAGRLAEAEASYRRVLAPNQTMRTPCICWVSSLTRWDAMT